MNLLRTLTAAWNRTRMSRWDTDNVSLVVGLLCCVVVAVVQ